MTTRWAHAHDARVATPEGAVGPDAGQDADIAAATVAVRRFLSSRLRERSLVEDLTQETLVKVLEVRHRLEATATVPYAVTVAKHLLVGRARAAAVAERHMHRLASDPVAPPPDDLVLRREDEAALRTALRALPEGDRALLLSHVVDGAGMESLAMATGGSAGGVAAKLSRARARARVDYVVASNGVTLPTARCRPVLLSLSAADQRRQQTVRVADHLLGCAVCADLGPQLLQRRRSIVALLPIPVLARMLGWARHLIGGHPAASLGGALGAAAVATAVVVAGSGAPHRAASTIDPSSTSRPRAPVADLDVRTLLPLAPAQLRGLAGRRVVARAMLILSVPADEGFWIGDTLNRRIWVELTTHGESAVRVLPGHRASFRGALSLHGPGYAARSGVDASEGASQLTNMSAHLTVKVTDLTTSP